MDDDLKPMDDLKLMSTSSLNLTSSISSWSEGCLSRVRAVPPGASMRGAGSPSSHKKTPPCTGGRVRYRRESAVQQKVAMRATKSDKSVLRNNFYAAPNHVAPCVIAPHHVAADVEHYQAFSIRWQWHLDSVALQSQPLVQAHT